MAKVPHGAADDLATGEKQTRTIEIFWRVDCNSHRVNLNHRHRYPKFEESENFNVLKRFEWSLGVLRGEQLQGFSAECIHTYLALGGREP